MNKDKITPIRVINLREEGKLNLRVINLRETIK